MKIEKALPFRFAVVCIHENFKALLNSITVSSLLPQNSFFSLQLVENSGTSCVVFAWNDQSEVLQFR